MLFYYNYFHFSLHTFRVLLLLRLGLLSLFGLLGLSRNLLHLWFVDLKRPLHSLVLDRLALLRFVLSLDVAKHLEGLDEVILIVHHQVGLPSGKEVLVVLQA